jgi:quinoprotein glucose dehydrogenase
MNSKKAKRITAWLLGILLFITGVLLAAGGAWLAILGGSAYYLLAGAGCAISGILVFRARSAGLAIFLLVFVGTLIWALTEVGLSFWELLPRIALLLAFALACSVPTARAGMESVAARRMQMANLFAVLFAALVLAAAFVRGQPQLVDHAVPDTAAASSVVPGQPDDWPWFGRTAAGTRYSPDTQITPANVTQLKVAWTYRTGDNHANYPHTKGPMSFESVPLKIGNALYLCTAHNIVVSLEADTGKERWRFDPRLAAKPLIFHTCRGVSYHESQTLPAGECHARILLGTTDGRLIALDAANGRRCSDFGIAGEISLQEGMGPDPGYLAFPTSPPAVIGDVAVIGSFVADNLGTGEPSGVVRAYDVKSGRLVWAWDSGRPDDAPELKPGETYSRGSPNAWSVFSADPKLRLVYIPTGNATPDYVGKHRTALDNRYSSSVVALDADTGRVRWHFQTTHYDLWDYDVPAEPVLFDFPSEAGSVPAVAVATKRGELFILDRRTGNPLVPVVERPAPRGAIPGENYSPTQPYSALTLAPAPLQERDMWGTTPFDQLWCRIQFRSFDYRGNFTPPSVHGSIEYPGNGGVLNWGSVALDEGREVLIAGSATLPLLVRLLPRVEADKISSGGQIDVHSGFAAQTGTPYGLRLRPFLSPLGIPCSAPPWGKLTAIDLQTRQILWQIPLGTAEQQAPLGIAAPGVFNIGGPMVTRSGLIFIAATIDGWFRAFDIASGRELWRAKLPAGGQSVPITYTSTSTGKQYVVLAAGGHDLVGTASGDYVVAFSLPDAPR